MSEPATPVEAARALAPRTAWSRNLPVPLRAFLDTEVSGAVVLLVAALAALVWVNSPWGSTYDSLWSTDLSFGLGSWAWTATCLASPRTSTARTPAA